LAGFETGFEAPDSPAPFTELPEDLSQVG